MPIWRCPHCGVPQEESSRCWVCHRSTTSCATCRHFRRGVAGGLGTCGLDPRHPALRGSEMRECWASPQSVAVATAGGAVAVPAASRPNDRPAIGRTFVPVDEVERAGDAEPPVAIPPGAAANARAARDGWSLWGDAES